MLRHPVKANDEGAVAVVVAVVMTFVLLPLCIYVIDTGGLYVERRQLQHGADAAVMAVARSCAVSCDVAEADTLSSANDDRGATVVEVCGSLVGTSCSPGNPDPSASPYDCEPLPTSSSGYVQVQVKSAGPGWKPWFHSNTVSVPACARAGLGPLGGLSGGFPITMSICEWDAATSGGYAPPPPYSPWPASPVVPDPVIYEKIIELQSGGASTDTADPGCMRGPANSFVPGGFGWVAGPGCTAVVDDTGTAGGGSGASEELECKTILETLWAAKKPIFLPVHDVSSGSGGGSFHVAGYAAFVLTGYDLSSAGKRRSWLTNQFPSCPGAGGSGKCITGFFTQALAPSGSSVSSGTNFGATTPYLIS